MRTRLVLEADTVALLDAIAKMQDITGNGTEGIGVRVASMLLTGEAGLPDQAALLGIYGIAIKEITTSE